MKLLFISDTHNLHRHYGLEPWGKLPDSDVLIHCGDITTHGTEDEVETFLQWLCSQPHPYKIWIAGNHDRCLEGMNPYSRWPEFARWNIFYLNETGVNIEGISFWGSPYTPDHCDFAFQLHQTGKERWSKIPDGTDVLITHGPPFGILDIGHEMDHAGCPFLLEQVTERVEPRIHAFGHIHQCYGRYSDGWTDFINASVHTWLWKPNEVERRDPQRFNYVKCTAHGSSSKN